jgi:FkbM family methyltransferase
MRASLLFNPFDLVERLAIASKRRRRRLRLKGTPAAQLSLGHIDSLELLEMLRENPPGVIHDVGANVGTWTCLAKSIFPDAAIEAFEPLEMHRAAFAQWTSAWPDVRLHLVALGSSDGTAEIEVTDFADASSVLSLTEDGRKTFNTAPAERRTIRMATLDALVASGEVRQPDLIKLDIQGYELEALRGASKVLESASAVICEVSFRQFYKGQALFPEVIAFLADRGLGLKAFGQSLGVGEPLSQADALFTR